jgi:hypothetical protein
MRRTLAIDEKNSGPDHPNTASALNNLATLLADLDHQEAHLLYTRAVEAQGRLDEAEEEYAALSRYYAGFEARSRYALLLLRRGEPAKARALFEDVVRAAGARPLLVSAADKDWLKVAKANL